MNSIRSYVKGSYYIIILNAACHTHTQFVHKRYCGSKRDKNKAGGRQSFNFFFLVCL